MSDQIGAFALTSAFERAQDWMVDLAESGGPDFLVLAHKKTAEEAEELAETPEDIEEWSDVFICLSAVAARNGWTMADLATATHAKVTKNQAREYAKEKKLFE